MVLCLRTSKNLFNSRYAHCSDEHSSFSFPRCIPIYCKFLKLVGDLKLPWRLQPIPFILSIINTYYYLFPFINDTVTLVQLRILDRMYFGWDDRTNYFIICSISFMNCAYASSLACVCCGAGCDGLLNTSCIGSEI